MILKKRSWSDFECKFKVNQMDSDVILGACSHERRMFPRAPRVPSGDVCFHERRVFPRAELVATTFNRGRFLSSWKKNF
ncbi:MAG: hypothetical protein ACJAYM_002331, partial [Flavobacteriales bacterium]